MEHLSSSRLEAKISGLESSITVQGSPLKIETQNVNVPACCLYTKQGCPLARINQHAYQNSADVTGEITLVWYYDLKSASTPAPAGEEGAQN